MIMSSWSSDTILRHSSDACLVVDDDKLMQDTYVVCGHKYKQLLSINQ